MATEQLVKTYWWKEEPNFGDALSPLIASEILGVGYEWAPLHECDLILVG